MRRGGKTFQLVSKGANIFHFNLKGCRNALFQPKKSHNFELKPQPDHEKGSITCMEMCYFILKYFKKICIMAMILHFICFGISIIEKNWRYAPLHCL